MKVNVSDNQNGPFSEITGWVDTAFDGHLVLPASEIQRLGLRSLAQTEAVLADGSIIVLESYYCVVQWFGTTKAIQAIENDGQTPLIGTELLGDRDLRINYRDRQFSIT